MQVTADDQLKKQRTSQMDAAASSASTVTALMASALGMIGGEVKGEHVLKWWYCKSGGVHVAEGTASSNRTRIRRMHGPKF